MSARIQEIQARAERPPLPGEFRAMLDRSLGSDAGANRASADSGTGGASRADVAFTSWQPTSPMTLGVMLGTPASAPASGGTEALTSFPGIATSSELQTYLGAHGVEGRNGHLGEGDLVAVSGGWNDGAKLLPPAATAWESMREAAAAEGIDLKVIDSYRTWESQSRAYDAHLRGEKKANVLPPGHSEHGVGLAVDVTNGSIIGTDDPEWAWLQQNATRFGWHPISNETWHWEFRGVSG